MAAESDTLAAALIYHVVDKPMALDELERNVEENLRKLHMREGLQSLESFIHRRSDLFVIEHTNVGKFVRLMEKDNEVVESNIFDVLDAFGSESIPSIDEILSATSLNAVLQTSPHAASKSRLETYLNSSSSSSSSSASSTPLNHNRKALPEVEKVTSAPAAPPPPPVEKIKPIRNAVPILNPVILRIIKIVGSGAGNCALIREEYRTKYEDALPENIFEELGRHAHLVINAHNRLDGGWSLTTLGHVYLRALRGEPEPVLPPKLKSPTSAAHLASSAAAALVTPPVVLLPADRQIITVVELTLIVALANVAMASGGYIQPESQPVSRPLAAPTPEAMIELFHHHPLIFAKPAPPSPASSAPQLFASRFTDDAIHFLASCNHEVDTFFRVGNWCAAVALGAVFPPVPAIPLVAALSMRHAYLICREFCCGIPFEAPPVGFVPPPPPPQQQQRSEGTPTAAHTPQQTAPSGSGLIASSSSVSSSSPVTPSSQPNTFSPQEVHFISQAIVRIMVLLGKKSMEFQALFQLYYEHYHEKFPLPAATILLKNRHLLALMDGHCALTALGHKCVALAHEKGEAASFVHIKIT